MKSFTVPAEDDGTRMDRFLARILPNAGRGFLEKMLRKKTIVKNGKRSAGKDRLHTNDVIEIYFSDETFQTFSAGTNRGDDYERLRANRSYRPYINIVHEDDSLLVLNKPAGVRSQLDHRQGFSLNEYMLSYLIDSASLSREDFFNFRPSVMNRLDVNTSGLVLCAKTRPMARRLSRDLKEKTIRKTYRAIVCGECALSGTCRGFLIKDERTNISRFSEEQAEGAKEIASVFRPVSSLGEYSLIEAELLTGRSHQLRAQLSALGHPILFDPKYGDRSVNHRVSRERGIKKPHQALHAWQVQMPDGQTFRAPVPELFDSLCRGLQ